jgi:hypothetical protein
LYQSAPAIRHIAIATLTALGHFLAHMDLLHTILGPDPAAGVTVILMLILIEGILSVDNAAVLATMVMRLPDPLTQLTARMGDLVTSVPWCTETLTMLGSDNVGNPAAFEQLLGRQGVHYSQLVATAWR